MPLSEWRKALGPLLGACIAALVIGLVWHGWHEMEWVLLGFVIVTIPIVLVRLARYRRTAR